MAEETQRKLAKQQRKSESGSSSRGGGAASAALSWRNQAKSGGGIGGIGIMASSIGK